MSLWIQNITDCPVRTLVCPPLTLPLNASYDSPSVYTPCALGYIPPLSLPCVTGVLPLI